MDSSVASKLNNSSWSDIRKRADSLGIPAWRLAEDLSFHLKDGTVAVDYEYPEQK